MATHRSDTPLYRRLARQLQERIDAGTYPAGSRLPSEPELSADFGVNRLTVRQAVAELERAAVLEIRRGVGTFVRPPSVRVSIAVDPRSQRFDLGSVHRALPLGTELPDGAAGTVEGDGEAVVAAPAVGGSAEDEEAARHLGRATGELSRVDTVIRIGGRPRVANSYWVPTRPLPAELLQPGRPGNMVPALAGAAGVELEYDWRAFGAIGADLADAELLGVPPGTPLLVREGVSCTPDGTPALYVRRRIDGSSARFVLHYREPGGTAGTGGSGPAR
ncbi:GntR family transcriptional regulator, phosphonate transport system regulatory protein [Streptomyces sp. TLI_053]|uniref:GntR family transcriptional regulator n=1 Tax=Streptomyces sp. TLI_053 TaxID=1855352 RepID=UPI00087D3A27|nr:GntR family transcriptional regulator [Streptomyces sp. TLI_053]SDT50986.1 GntR family transcriptional regulator, phosphonate transport system regulatory protein [Streptomyces sp. TLI_053]